MKTIVVYQSQTGFTKRYAQWIAEAAGAECLSLKEAKRQDLASYDAIVFGGWVCAGCISGLSWLKSHIEEWSGKKLIAFCVGGSPMDNPEVVTALRQNFSEAQQKRVEVFYCPGGFNYEKMSVSSKLMMKLFVKMLKAKKNPTEAEKEMARMLSTSYDLSDPAYIQPILEYLNR